MACFFKQFFCLSLERRSVICLSCEHIKEVVLLSVASYWVILKCLLWCMVWVRLNTRERWLERQSVACPASPSKAKAWQTVRAIWSNSYYCTIVMPINALHYHHYYSPSREPRPVAVLLRPAPFLLRRLNADRSSTLYFVIIISYHTIPCICTWLLQVVHPHNHHHHHHDLYQPSHRRLRLASFRLGQCLSHDQNDHLFKHHFTRCNSHTRHSSSCRLSKWWNKELIILESGFIACFYVDIVIVIINSTRCKFISLYHPSRTALDFLRKQRVIQLVIVIYRLRWRWLRIWRGTARWWCMCKRWSSSGYGRRVGRRLWFCNKTSKSKRSC